MTQRAVAIVADYLSHRPLDQVFTHPSGPSEVSNIGWVERIRGRLSASHFRLAAFFLP
jgi:hypothetical protein